MAIGTGKKGGSWKFFIGIVAVIGVIMAIAAFSMIAMGVSFSNKIAVVEIRGAISSGQQLLTETVTPNDIFQMIDKIEEDPTIKGALFAINSPGGSVVASREISQAVKDMGKPTLCWMGDVAASGAYWIASSCDHIMADPLTMTGSIGVTASYLEFSELFDKYGVTYERITSGDMKDMGTPFRNMSEEEREEMEYITEEIFKYFLEEITNNRGLGEEQVNKIKSGGIFLGKDAVQLGLVDSLGTMKDAKEKAKEMAGVENAEFYILKKKGLTIFDLIGMF